MFKRPEELIMAALAVLWVVLTFFVASYWGLPTQTALLITVLTLVWAAVLFLLWQRNLSYHIWPVFLGLLVACWWPFWDWYAVRDIVAVGGLDESIVVSKPWYATWTFKLILAAVPIAFGYWLKWRMAQKRRLAERQA